MDTKEDLTLCEFQKGNTLAFETYFNRYKKQLSYFAQDILKKKPEIAEEIVSDSFLKLWERRQDFASEQNIKAFLFIATKNSCLTYLKSFHQTKMVNTEQINEDSLVEDPAIYQSLIRSEALAILNREIENLSPIQKKVIQMSHLEDRETKEISENLNMTANAVHVNYSRAVQQLRKKLIRKKDWLF